MGSHRMLRKSHAPVKVSPISPELVERRIYVIRGHKVMLDSDLAELYKVATKALNQAVRRNSSRFPEDFMFQLTPEEAEALRSQIVTAKMNRGGRRSVPYAFTEHGIAMLSSVLKSARAVQMNIAIVRTFIKLRDMVAGNKELARRLDRVETRLKLHHNTIGVVIDEIKRLRTPPAKPQHRIGFVAQQK